MGLRVLQRWGRTGEGQEDAFQDKAKGSNHMTPITWEVDRPGLLWPCDVEAQGNVIVPCTCLKGSFRKDEAFLCRGKRLRKGKLCRLRLGMRKNEMSLAG